MLATKMWRKFSTIAGNDALRRAGINLQDQIASSGGQLINNPNAILTIMRFCNHFVHREGLIVIGSTDEFEAFEYEHNDQKFVHALCFSSEERFQAWDQPRLGLLPDQETDFFGGRSSTVTMRGSELFARLYSYSNHEPPWKGVQLDAEFTFDVPSPILDSEMSAHELKTYLQSFLGLNPKSPWDRMQTNEKRLDWLRKAQYVIPITNKLIEPVERDGKKLLPIFVNGRLAQLWKNSFLTHWGQMDGHKCNIVKGTKLLTGLQTRVRDMKFDGVIFDPSSHDDFVGEVEIIGDDLRYFE